MSRTLKDSKKHRKATVLEVVGNDGGTFDMFLNHTLLRSGITEMWLPDELCGRFGFCGEESRLILEELSKNGRITLRF